MLGTPARVNERQKSRSRMKVPDVEWNLVPDTWTADGEGVSFIVAGVTWGK